MVHQDLIQEAVMVRELTHLTSLSTGESIMFMMDTVQDNQVDLQIHTDKTVPVQDNQTELEAVIATVPANLEEVQPPMNHGDTVIVSLGLEDTVLDSLEDMGPVKRDNMALLNLVDIILVPLEAIVLLNQAATVLKVMDQEEVLVEIKMVETIIEAVTEEEETNLLTILMPVVPTQIEDRTLAATISTTHLVSPQDLEMAVINVYLNVSPKKETEYVEFDFICF